MVVSELYGSVLRLYLPKTNVNLCIFAPDFGLSEVYCLHVQNSRPLCVLPDPPLKRKRLLAPLVCLTEPQPRSPRPPAPPGAETPARSPRCGRGLCPSRRVPPGSRSAARPRLGARAETTLGQRKLQDGAGRAARSCRFAVPLPAPGERPSPAPGPSGAEERGANARQRGTARHPAWGNGPSWRLGPGGKGGSACPREGAPSRGGGGLFGKASAVLRAPAESNRHFIPLRR